MTSGTPTEKKEYSKEEIITMLYHFEQQAAKTYRDSQRKIADRLAKGGIPLNEYTAFAIEKEKKDAVLQAPGEGV